jgi:hypothetical protein
MRRTLLLTAALSFLLLLADPGVAATCPRSSSEPTAQQEAGTITLYVIVDPCDESCNAWVYRETNGIAGLQRHDEFKDDTCGGVIPGDALVL